MVPKNVVSAGSTSQQSSPSLARQRLVSRGFELPGPTVAPTVMRHNDSPTLSVQPSHRWPVAMGRTTLEFGFFHLPHRSHNWMSSHVTNHSVLLDKPHCISPHTMQMSPIRPQHCNSTMNCSSGNTSLWINTNSPIAIRVRKAQSPATPSVVQPDLHACDCKRRCM